jgi:hypothetical protein
MGVVAQIPHIEPLHFGIRSDGTGHRLRLSLAKRRHDTFMRMFDFSSPELGVLANSILRCSGSNPAAPATQWVSMHPFCLGLATTSARGRAAPRCGMPERATVERETLAKRRERKAGDGGSGGK